MVIGLTNTLNTAINNKMAGGKFNTTKIRSNQLKFFIDAN
jgi:hypothetical protein